MNFGMYVFDARTLIHLVSLDREASEATALPHVASLQ
jgi:hypothetical protein